jgi:hypothetical protein
MIDMRQEVAAIVKTAVDAVQTTNGFWNDRYQAGKGLIGDEQGRR